MAAQAPANVAPTVAQARAPERLLVATDLTPRSAGALARAIRIAAGTGAAIRIVHAVPPWTPVDDAVAIRKRILTEARLMAEEMRGGEPDLSVTLSRRRPEDAILRKAGTFDADLILLGAHGEPRFRDALFGTKAGHVVRGCDRPLLIVQDPAALPYRKVMVALDEPALAEPVLAAAAAIAPAAEEIFAVHACEPPASPLFGEGRSRAERQEMAAGLDAFLRAHLPSAKAAEHVVVETGELSALLVSEAFARAPDLVAMGRHRHSPFLGSHATDALGWCRSDLLIVPDRQRLPVAATLAATAT